MTDATPVLHYMERYPLPQQDYIFRQVVASRGDAILALDRAAGVPDPLPVVPVRFAARPALGTGRIHRGLDRTLWAVRARQLRAGLVEARPPVVHAHFGMAGARLAAAGRTPAPLVTTFYGVDASACLRDATWLSRYRPLWRRGALFIVLAEEVAGRLSAAGCSADRIRVWNLGIDLKRYPVVARRPSTDGSLRVVCAARFVEKKGHDVLLEAIALLRREREVRLTMLGYGPGLQRVRAMAERLGLRSVATIVDTSQARDFDALYADALSQSDVLALPSRVAADGDDEGGPALTVICAQAAGVPVVVTPFAGAERSVSHEATGLLCDGTPASLAEQLARVASDHVFADAIGQAGARLVREQFDLPTQLDKLAGLYAEVTS